MFNKFKNLFSKKSDALSEQSDMIDNFENNTKKKLNDDKVNTSDDLKETNNTEFNIKLRSKETNNNFLNTLPIFEVKIIKLVFSNGDVYSGCLRALKEGSGQISIVDPVYLSSWSKKKGGNPRTHISMYQVSWNVNDVFMVVKDKDKNIYYFCHNKIKLATFTSLMYNNGKSYQMNYDYDPAKYIFINNLTNTQMHISAFEIEISATQNMFECSSVPIGRCC